MKFEFWKYEGLGNDFVIVDARRLDERTRAAVGPEMAIRMCDRHFGAGADGLLRLDSPAGPGVVRMTVLNADGSIAEMCGNGLRCVGRYLVDRGGCDGREPLVETGAGPLLCRVLGDDVEVDLGGVEDEGVRTVDLAGQSVTGRALRLGNPHFVARVPAGRDEAARWGEAAQAHADFPSGVNLSCRRFTAPGAVELHVYERGCGLTFACGTGAGATVAAAWLDGDARPGTPVRVRLPGGELTISGSLDGLRLRGPAREIYRGVWLAG